MYKYKIFLRKSERKRLFWRLRQKLEDNINKNFKIQVVRVMTGFIWLRTGARGGLL
jgi:hypothetical protein